VRPLPKWEVRAWKEQQGRVYNMDRAISFANFVDGRLEYATNMVATSEQLVLPKPIPLHSQRLQRLPSSEHQGGGNDHGNYRGQNA
jgi:hypothetical protein